MLATESPLVVRLRSVPGVGLLIATALVAFVGDPARFPSGSSVLAHAKRTHAPRDGLRAWALGREGARGHSKAAVALANKLARIVWAVWRHEQPFQARKEEGSPSH